MKYYATRFFLFALFFALLVNLSAQDKKTQSLLWRIQKDGGMPSFLFGTMHISDKKAFNFRDSLYTYLQQAEAFALEFNPDSANQIIAAYMSGEIDPGLIEEPHDYSTVTPPDSFLSISDTVVSISRVTFSESDTTFSAPGPKKPEPVSSKRQHRNLVDQFAERIANNKKRESESMNTFLDAYLYEMASRQGKKIFGLEGLEGKGEVIRALKSGLKENKADLFNEWDRQDEESAIHRLYFKEDLDSLELYYSEFFEEKALDIFLYARNQVMVQNMDSIMQVQTLFAAVGAGHLSGDKGIIALLRGKGYTVEPVISETRIAAEKFEPGTGKSRWQLLNKEEYGFQVEMPGIFKTQDAANGRKIVYHYDIGGGSFFMASFGKLSSKEKGKGLHEIVTGHLDEMLNSAGGRILSKKSLEAGGLKMIEAVCLYNDDSYYRYREIVKGNLYYILAIGSEKKNNLFTEKAEEFVNSFRTLDIPTANWSTFAAPGDGFSAKFPGKPQIEDMPLDKESASTITLKSYSYFDANNGASYLVSAGKALANHEYQDGEGFFQNYIDFIKQVSTEEPVFTDTIMDGYAGKFFTGGNVYNKLSGLILHRGNTSYYVIAEYDSANAVADANKFLRSFKINAFAKPAWNTQQSPNREFSAWLPGKIELKTSDSTAYDFKPGKKNYYGYDPFAAITYNLEVFPISKYYWSPNPDSLYNSWKDKVIISWNDSLVKYATISNGALQGREIVKVDKTSGERTVLRLLLNGNDMYVLSASWPRIHADEENINRFFGDFRVNDVRSFDNILKNDPGALFADLHSNDSITFQQAYKALDEVDFYENDIILLMEKAIQQYPGYANNYNRVNDVLLQQVQEFFTKNETPKYREQVLNFIKENYAKHNLADSTRFYLLGIVASDKTQASYQLLGDLLAYKKISAGNNFRLFYKLYDSLALTSMLYPGLLDHLGDTTINFAIVTLTKKLIDSNLLHAAVLLPVKTKLLDLARVQRTSLMKGNTDDTYEIPDLVDLLGLLRQKETDDLIAGFLKVKDTRVRKSAALVLLRNKKPVPAPVILAIANDPQFRVEFFEDLKKLGKENLFPPDHRSQVDFAESYIFTAVFDEYEDYTRPELVFIKKMEYDYKGEQKIFYIFRANYEYDNPEETDDEENALPKIEESYFTVAGPFDTDEAIFTIDEKENISGMWYDDQFDGMKNDYFFSKYLEQRLKWQNEIKK